MKIDMICRGNSTLITNQRRNRQRLTSPFKFLLEFLTHYKTPKVVRFESKWIASLSFFVKLSLAIGCTYLMCQRNSYQMFDRSPISSVTIEVTQSSNSSVRHYFPSYDDNQTFYDVNDFIIPAVENSAITITTRTTEIEHVLRRCDEKTIRNNTVQVPASLVVSTHQCSHEARCIIPPFYRPEYVNGTTLQKTPLCWWKTPDVHTKDNYQALDYILLIKNYVEFPLLGYLGSNLVSNITNTCEYDPDHQPRCPRFRILKILQMIENKTEEYERMFFYGSLIEIKISWKCNLGWWVNHSELHYQFERLDHQPYEDNPYQPGSNFFTSRHFFRPNDKELRRVHTTIYNLHIIVSVTGEAGKFDLFQTTTSIGSFLGIFGTGTIVCDLIAAFITNFKSVKYDSR